MPVAFRSCAIRGAAVRAASTAAGLSDKEKKKAFSATLLLPKTDMPLRQKNAPVAEKKFRDRTTHELYRQQVCLGRMTNETLTMGRERSTTFMLSLTSPVQG